MSLEERVSALLRAADDRAAATAVIEACGPRVHRFLGAALGDPALADDAYSLFCEWVWRGVRSFECRSSLRTWSFGVAANAARRVREDPWRRRARLLSTAGLAQLAERRPPSSAESRERRARWLEAVRAELSAEDQLLLALRVDQQLSWNEIEAALAIGGSEASAVALRRRYVRLRARLEGVLRARGALA